MLDFYNIKSLFPNSSIRYQSKIREILEANLGEHINGWWNEDKTPNEIHTTLTDLGAFGEHALSTGALGAF